MVAVAAPIGEKREASRVCSIRLGGYIEPVLGFGEAGGTGMAVIFGVRATHTRHPSGACMAGVSRVRGQAVSTPYHRAGAARARVGGGAAADADASQGARGERRRRVKSREVERRGKAHSAG